MNRTAYSYCRRHFLPPAVLVLALAACTSPAPQETEREAAVPVRIAILEEGSLTRSVEASASLSAEHRVTVASRVGGPVVLAAEEGTTVSAHDSVVLGIDDESLRHQVKVAEQDVAVAERALAVRQADQRRIAADLAKASTDATRWRRLHDVDGAVSAEAAEAQESRLAQVAAAAQAAEAATALAEQQLIQARHGLAIAQRALADATLTAPIDGVVVRRLHEPGEMIGPQMPVLQIENPGLLRLSLHLNASHRPLLSKEETVVEVLDGPAAGHHLPIQYLASTIDPVLRTVELRALWSEPPEGVLSGQAVRVRVIVQTAHGLIVPDDALLTHDGQTLVALAEDNTARLVPVERRLHDQDRVIITSDDPALRPGAQIIIAGHDRLQDGQRIRALESGDRIDNTTKNQ